MSSLFTTIRDLLGPPDPRSEREIENEIEDEFAFHIEQLEVELIEQGVPPEHAPDLARARFGNQTKLKQRCKRIALEERIMLQRINFGLMLIVLLAVVGMSVQMLITQKSSHETLEAITAELSALRAAVVEEATDESDAAEPVREAATAFSPHSTRAVQGGTWVQVDEAGRPLPDGKSIELYGHLDVRSHRGLPTISMNLGEAYEGVRFVLDGRGSISFTGLNSHTGGREQGRWRLHEDGSLEINIAPSIPEFPEPMRFRHVDNLDAETS